MDQPTPQPTAPFRVMLASGSWERDISTLRAALRSLSEAPQPAALYDSRDQRIGPDGSVWLEVG